MQHPGKAAIAGVPNPPLPLVDLPTGSPEAKASLQVEQELKSRRGRPLSRIRDEQPQGANDSRGEVAWGSGSKSSEGADLAEQETDQESMYQRATSSTQRQATETLTRAPHAGAAQEEEARGMEVTPKDALSNNNMPGIVHKKEATGGCSTNNMQLEESSHRSSTKQEVTLTPTLGTTPCGSAPASAPTPRPPLASSLESKREDSPIEMGEAEFIRQGDKKNVRAPIAGGSAHRDGPGREGQQWQIRRRL